MTKPQLTIRFATEADVPLIFGFIQGIAEFEKLSHLVGATPEKIASHLFGSNRYVECLLGFYEETCVGFALFFHNYSSFVAKPGIYLEDLYINPEFRGKGFGKRLLLELIKLAKERNCGRVEWSVLNWNTDAIAFYESLGAQAMKEWTVYRLGEKEINALV